MYAVTALLQLASLQALFSGLELALHLYASFFPQQPIIEEVITSDFIIVGAGSAGCVLAARLSENPNHNVLLIEAGDNPALEEMVPGLALLIPGTAFGWNYTSIPNNKTFQCYKNNEYQTVRGRGIDGTSGINYMMYVRGDPNDYNEWAKVTNNPTWNYTNVLPYFIKSERNENPEVMNSPYRVFHGTEGEMRVNKFPDPKKLKYMKSLNEIGYKTVLDTNGNYTLGITYSMYNIGDRMRQGSCTCFVSPVADRKNLRILRNAKVTRVMIENKKAVGVEIIMDSNKNMTLKANLEVILSAGVYNSPQLLMLSGIGPKKHLESHKIKTIMDLPVGFNLQDHAGLTLVHKTEPYKKPDPPRDYSKPPFNFINCFVSLNKSQTYPDGQIALESARDRTGIPNFYAYFLKIQDDITETAYKASEYKNGDNDTEKFIGRELLFTAILNLRPFSRGRVTLRSADPLDAPGIRLGTFDDKRDLEKTIQLIKNYIAIEKSSYFRSVNAERVELAGDRCKDFPKDSDDYWRCYVLCLMMAWHHPTSTCSMGSVLDSYLRVIGIDGLRVVDASSMPIVPSGNTHVPTVMVAEKAADMIKADHCK